MKTIHETGTRDIIITHSLQAKKDENGNVIWNDEPNNIAVCNGKVTDIKFYECIHSGDDSTWTQVKFTANEIKNLYKKIIEIEAQETAEFID